MSISLAPFLTPACTVEQTWLARVKGGSRQILEGAGPAYRLQRGCVILQQALEHEFLHGRRYP